MAVKVGINGFGRIGRNFLRAVRKSGADVDFVGVNDITDAKTLAHLLKYDSVLGRLDADVTVSENGISVDGDELRVFAERDPAAVAELARRYFTSHGPATVHDFAWWSNLTIAEARGAVADSVGSLDSMTVEGREYWFAPSAISATSSSDAVYLLPGFDEYVLGYQDRSAVLAPEHARSIVPGNNGMFMATIVSPAGEVLGTWRRKSGKGGISVVAEPFTPLSVASASAFEAAARGYAAFLGVELASV